MFDAGGRGRGGGLSSVWLKEFTRHLRELRKAHERQAAHRLERLKVPPQQAYALLRTRPRLERHRGGQRRWSVDLWLTSAF